MTRRGRDGEFVESDDADVLEFHPANCIDGFIGGLLDTDAPTPCWKCRPWLLDPNAPKPRMGATR